MYTVIVNLQVKPDMVEAFLEAIGETSRASRRDEPGCLRFDVHRDNDDPNHFVLYELYVDEHWAAKILEQPEVWGVEELGPDGIRVRLVAKTRPLEQWKVARELRARLKVAFDQAGIEVSAQKVTTASTAEDQGQPAA